MVKILKIHKTAISVILITTFLIGLITTNLFEVNIKHNSEIKDNKISQEVETDLLYSVTPFSPPPDVPNEGFKWNFDNGTIKAFNWVMSSEEEVHFGTQYYNITSMPYVFNQSGMNSLEYCVQVQELYYNTTFSTHFPNPLNSDLAYVSLLNLSIGTEYFIPMMPPSEEQEGPGPNFIFMVNTFIPKNGSSGFPLDWIAFHLKNYYEIFMGVSLSYEVDDSSPVNIYLYSVRGDYVNLTYDDTGILTIGKIRFMEGGDIWRNLIIIVDDNINPVDNIEWSVKEGDVFYYGIGSDEYRFNVTKIVNETHIVPNIGIVVVETVWANLSFWIYEPGYIGWTTPPYEIRIGSANEIYPLFVFTQNIIPFILPKNYDMKLIAQIYKMIADTGYDQVTYGDTWFKIYNSTTKEYATFEYNISGLIDLLDSQKLYNIMGMNDFGAYRKNSTEIDPGFHSFNMKPLGIKDFNVTLNISIINQRTHLMYSAFDINPMNITLNYGALFIDIWVNDSNNLDQTNFSPINITIKYDPSKYPNMKLYYINTSLSSPENSWIPIEFKSLGNGVIIFTYNYTGIFAFTNAPIPPFLIGDDDDDDGGEAAPAIPLGNYYLIFLLVGMIGIVIYTKRKLLFK